MLGITFSAEAEPSAAERISDCFQYFESRMDVIRLARYCKVLDSIKIILFTVLSAILLFPQIYFAGCSHILDFF